MIFQKINNKKGELPALKTILILLVAITILISYLLILISSKNFEIDDKKIKTQLILKKIISNNCFGKDYATFQEDMFNQNNLDKCLGTNKNIYVKVYIKGKEKLYLNNEKNEFLKRKKTCSFLKKSNLLCSDIRYPITYISSNGKTEMKILIVQLLVY